MDKEWNQVTIQQCIDDETEESLTLEYKGAGSLGRGNREKDEITKDVSAMANSAGGTVIYGVAEFRAEGKKHLPERIDPIDRTVFSKEWLEQVINNIRPRMDGVVITPVSLDTGPNDVVYVVDAPQSATAHQAADFRYYKRYNFSSVPMQDFEIRDVMGRQKHPRIDLEFKIVVTTERVRESISGVVVWGQGKVGEGKVQTAYNLQILASNKGHVYARYVNALIRVPKPVSYLDGVDDALDADHLPHTEYMKDNTRRDVVDWNLGFEKYGPSWFDPILPGLTHIWNIRLRNDFAQQVYRGLQLEWQVYADNAPRNSGTVSIEDIEIVDRLNTSKL